MAIQIRMYAYLSKSLASYVLGIFTTDDLSELLNELLIFAPIPTPDWAPLVHLHVSFSELPSGLRVSLCNACLLVWSLGPDK